MFLWALWDTLFSEKPQNQVTVGSYLVPRARLVEIHEITSSADPVGGSGGSALLRLHPQT